MMMKRCIAATVLLVLLLGGCSSPPVVEGEMIVPENTYVVLLEMNDFPEGYSDLEVDFINSNQLDELFAELGVPEANRLVKQDELSLSDFMDAIRWVDESAPQDATVFFYLAAHGSYIRDELAWASFGPSKWSSLEQKNKILVIDACMSGQFVEAFADDPDSGLTYAVTQADELGWWGIEEEGLPIIGSIWTHYFIEGMLSDAADANGDQAISFTEAHTYAVPKIQTYMAEQVFVVDEFLEGYQSLGFDPLLKDGYPNPVMINHLDGPLNFNTLN